MKRKSFLAMAAGLSLSLFVSCVHKDQLPENPKDKQEHKDSHGNSWIYDAMLMRWLFMPSGGGQSHYYYPGTGNWTNSSGLDKKIFTVLLDVFSSLTIHRHFIPLTVLHPG